MKRYAKIIAFLFTFFGICHAKEIKLPSISLNGKEYKQVTISAEGRFKVKIVHSEGVSRVSSSWLPDTALSELGLIISAPKSAPTVVKASKMSDGERREIFQDVSYRNGWFKTDTIKVIQSTSVGKLVTIGGSFDTVLLIGDDEIRADGTVFNCIADDTGKTYEYTSVLGANKRVRIFSATKPISFENFIESLKSGQSFEVRDMTVSLICDKCKGRPIQCESCQNSGLIDVKKTLSVSW